VGQLHPVWDTQVVEGVADVLGDTAIGLTGTQIGQLLAELNLLDHGDGIAKRVLG